MRRALALLAVAVTVGTAGCSSTTRTPTVAKADFAPRAEIDIVAGCPDAIGCAGGSGSSASTYLSGPSVPGSDRHVRSVAEGSVLTVTSRVSGTHRVTGTVKDVPVFDTGQMVRGNSTTVVLQTPGTVVITDSTTGQHTRVVVRPAPTTKG
jgi:hypothetical protein